MLSWLRCFRGMTSFIGSARLVSLKLLRRSLIPLIVAFCMSSFALGAPFQFDHKDLAKQAIEKHIRPGYLLLAESTGALSQSMQDLCNTPTVDHLRFADEAYARAVMAWGRVEHLRFGPMAKNSRYERMAFWPDPKGIGRKQVRRALERREQSVASEQSLQNKSVALQGLTALEIILAGRGRDGLTKQNEAGEFRCQFGLAIAKNLATIASDVHRAWNSNDGYASLMLEPGPNNSAYLKPSEVTQEIARSFTSGLQTLRDFKIAGPIGLMPERRGRRMRPAFKTSGLTVATIEANIQGLWDLFVRSGLAEQLNAFSSGTGRRLQGELEQSLRVVRSVPEDARRDATDPRSERRLILTGFPLKNVRIESGRALANAAGLTLGFNAFDGD